MTRTPLRTLSLAILLTSSLAHAQAPGAPAAPGAPPPGAMLGQALYSSDLPKGVATVKVVGQELKELKVGQAVELHRESAGRRELVTTTKTGPDGRARFEGLEAGKSYVVVLPLPEGKRESAPFKGPDSGGVRLLIQTGTAAPAAGAAAPAAGTPPNDPVHGGAAADPAASGGLPPGHPPIPAGSGGEPDLTPKKGKTPGQSGTAEVTAVKELQPGTLEILVVKGKARAPVGATAVNVTEGQKKSVHRTNDKGQVLLRLAPKRAVTLSVAFAGTDYTTDAISLPDSGGLRATFTVYDKTSDPSNIWVGPGSHLLAQLNEQTIHFRQVFSLYNTGEALFEPRDKGLLLPLPEGAQQLQVPEEYAGLVTAEPALGAVRVVKPLPPGRLMIEVFYLLRYEGEALDVRQRLPVATAQTLLVVTNSDSVELSGPSVKGRRMEEQGGVKTPVFTLAPARAGTLTEFTISGLPTRNKRLTHVVLGLAGLLLLWGVVAAFGAGHSQGLRSDRREALLKELVELERVAADGSVPPAELEHRRATLKKELAGLWEEPV
ncbi:MAG: hypothetical protein IT371_29665 [Deltaproteobacteria bacterium]|nr:hypothetical protein [Deltaproteobacteria bacterium]